MAEQEQEEQASSQQEQESSTTGAKEQAQEQGEQIDYKKQYEELNASHTQLSQKAKEDAQLLEMVTPHVDWNAFQGRQVPATGGQEESEGDQERFISKKDHDETLRQVQSSTDTKIVTMQFRINHPELRDYEDTLVAPAIVKLRRENPHLGADQLVEKAAKFANDFLKAEREKGGKAKEQEGEEKEQEEKRKAAEAAKAGGFASAGTTAPATKEEKAGQTTEEYIKERQEQSRKARGVI